MTLQYEQTKKQYFLARHYILLSRSYLVMGIILLVTTGLLYFFNGIFFLVLSFAVFMALGLLMWASTLLGFRMFKNKKGVLPMGLEIADESLRLTIGNRQSKNMVTKVLEKSKVTKVWTNGKCVFVNHQFLTYPILVSSDKYPLLIKALTENGWFTKRRLTLKRWIALFVVWIICGVLGVLLGLRLFPFEPSTHSGVPAVEIKESDVLADLNAARADRKVSALALDQKLTTSANRSCHDMEANKYYESQNPKSGHHGYEYISEIYPDSYVDEVTLAVTNLSASDVVSQWVKDSQTKEWVLGATYTKAGVATCHYTADDKYQMLVVLHLAS